MTQMLRGIDALEAAMTGPVLSPGDPDYDKARAIFNGDIDRHPAAIARCRSAADVAAAIGFAREHEVEISVRGGAHAYSGTSLGDGCLTIDLSEIDQVAVDPKARRARVGGGATLAQLDAGTQAHGLAVPGGVISHTGVGGLTLGGGMGWLTNKFGLSIDNLVSVEMVLADGRIVRASADDRPHLFWAIRGGGGNFGVVTEFEFELHPVGPELHMGMFFWGLDQGTELLRFLRDYLPSLPADSGVLLAAGLSAPPAPFVPEQYHLMPGYAVIVVGLSTAQDHADLVAPLREALPPLFEFITPMPYAGLQQMLDENAPWGICAYEKAIDLDELSDDVIAVITEQAPRKTSPLSFMPIFYLHGAFTAVGEDATAYGGSRRAHYVCNIEAAAPTKEALAPDRQWVRDAWDALRPLAGNVGSYVNFMVEADEERVRASYGPAKYDRLAHIKAEYDPHNVFHRNANIRPS
jgi:FAD/FMN-containing dehydrogenase